jgi:hypothetical protein
MSKTISIELPTRGRVSLLHKFITTTFDFCEDKDDVELLLKVDADDEQTVEYCRTQLPTDVETHVVISERGDGYFDAQKHVDDLVSRAQGRIIGLFNDDVECNTKGWDTLIKQYADDRHSLLYPVNVFNHKWGNVFFVHRHLFDIAGTSGPFPGDGFWHAVCDIVSKEKALVSRDVDFDHADHSHVDWLYPPGLTRRPYHSNPLIVLNGVDAPRVSFTHHSHDFKSTWELENRRWDDSVYSVEWRTKVDETVRKICAEFNGHTVTKWEYPPNYRVQLYRSAEFELAIPKSAIEVPKPAPPWAPTIG